MEDCRPELATVAAATEEDSWINFDTEENMGQQVNQVKENDQAE